MYMLYFICYPFSLNSINLLKWTNIYNKYAYDFSIENVFW